MKPGHASILTFYLSFYSNALYTCNFTCLEQLISASIRVITISDTSLNCSESWVWSHGLWQENYKCVGGCLERGLTSDAWPWGKAALLWTCHKGIAKVMGCLLWYVKSGDDIWFSIGNAFAPSKKKKFSSLRVLKVTRMFLPCPVIVFDKLPVSKKSISKSFCKG